MKQAAYLFAFLISQCGLFSKDPQLIITGYQPLAIHRVADTVHVFCNGQDIDYDGVYEQESGEKPAMWLMYDANTYSLLNVVIMQNGYFDVPFRPGLSKTRMYLPRGNKVEVYDLSKQELIDSSMFILPDPKSKITAIHVITTKNSFGEAEMALALSHKTSFTGKGNMSVFSLITRQPLFQAEIGINPQMIRSYYNLQSQLEFAILCEGTFGGKNSTLHTINLTDPMQGMVYELGDTGNFFLIQDQLALTVMNGSHEIIPINLSMKSLLPSVPVGTTGYDGPREIILDSIQSRVYVSTYASDIRIGSFLDGTVLGQWNPKGKPEGMALINNTLWVCNAFKTGDYVPDSTIALFSLDESTSIHEETPATKGSFLSLAGNSKVIQLPIDIEQAEYRVIDSKGATVLRGMVEASGKELSFEGLPIGLYVVTVHSAKFAYSALVLLGP